MNTPAVIYSDDQAAAFDSVAEMLRHAGIDLDDSLLMPPAGGKDQVMAVTGKAGSGKTLLLAELYKALEAAGVEIVSGDYESRKRKDKRTLAILAPTNKAASVLRLRGVPATTIHRILYTPVYDPEYERIAEWLGECPLDCLVNNSGIADPYCGPLSDLALDDGPALLWEAKILTAVLFGSNAFLKFVWSHRLFNYCAIAMAAVPNEIGELAYARAAQAAEVNITAARAFNRGLRSVYFALASLAWLLGPLALIAVSLFTFAMLWRREFASVSRRALMENPPV